MCDWRSAIACAHALESTTPAPAPADAARIVDVGVRVHILAGISYYRWLKPSHYSRRGGKFKNCCLDS